MANPCLEKKTETSRVPEVRKSSCGFFTRVVPLPEFPVFQCFSRFPDFQSAARANSFFRGLHFLPQPRVQSLKGTWIFLHFRVLCQKAKMADDKSGSGSSSDSDDDMPTLEAPVGAASGAAVTEEDKSKQSRSEKKNRKVVLLSIILLFLCCAYALKVNIIFKFTMYIL